MDVTWNALNNFYLGKSTEDIQRVRRQYNYFFNGWKFSVKRPVSMANESYVFLVSERVKVMVDGFLYIIFFEINFKQKYVKFSWPREIFFLFVNIILYIIHHFINFCNCPKRCSFVFNPNPGCWERIWLPKLWTETTQNG